MKYYVITGKQLFCLSILISIIVSALITINILLKDYLMLPEVFIQEKDGQCIKVVNYVNGHAFNCNDVNVILRQYRKVIE